MKKLFFLIFTLSFSVFWAQKADEIVQNYIQKLGGKKLDKIHSALQKGTMNMNGMDFPMENYQSTDGKMYSKINMMGQDIIVFAFDGQKGYQFKNFVYEDIPDSLTTQFKAKAKNLFGYFYKYKERGSKIKYSGKQTFDGKETESILITFDKPVEGDIKNLLAYFDPESGLLIGVKIEKDGHTVITRPGNYKMFDGILQPTEITTEFDGNIIQTVKIDTIKFNPPEPDPKIFKKPEN